MVLLSQVDYKILKKMAYGLVILSWIFLVLGYFFKNPGNNASRWLFVGGRSWMTTSDFARVSLIIFTAYFIDNNKKKLHDPIYLSIHFTPLILISLLLILFQPDTSTAMMIGTIIMIMLFISGVNWKYLSGIIFCGIVGLTTKIIIKKHRYKQDSHGSPRAHT